MFYITEEELLKLDNLPMDGVYSYISMNFSDKEDYILDVEYIDSHKEKVDEYYHFISIIYDNEENLNYGRKDLIKKYCFDNFEEIIKTDIVIMG